MMLELLQWAFERGTLADCDRMLIESLIGRRKEWVELMLKVCLVKDRAQALRVLNCWDGILLVRCVAISLQSRTSAG